MLKSNPRWLGAFIVLTIVSATCYGLIHTYLVQSTLAHLPPTATNVDKQMVANSLNQELPVKLAFFPIRVFIGWAAFSLTLFYLCKAFTPRDPIRFSQIFSLEVHSEATSVIASLVVAVLTLSNPTMNTGPASMPLSILNFTDQDQSFILKTLLSSLNVFALWQILILSVGASVFCEYGKIKSALIVVLAWAFSILFNVATLKLVQDELHLLL
ncbi:MAG: hypothetical protein HW412_2025 [Bacteroidetes bacterium]|nr:hypothetical protein [Bacteroidota bacterium]